jgi:hypothetical protein
MLWFWFVCDAHVMSSRFAYRVTPLFKSLLLSSSLLSFPFFFGLIFSSLGLPIVQAIAHACHIMLTLTEAVTLYQAQNVFV